MSGKHLPALRELLEAESAAAIMEVILRHPGLLDDEVIEMLSRLAEGTNERNKPIVENLIAVLIECRAVGVAEAFENLELASVEGGAPETVERDATDDIAELIVVADDASKMKAVVKCYPQLLSDAVEQHLLEMEADSSAYTADRTYAIINFLRACRSGDLDGASAAYTHDLAEVENASRLAAEYTFLEDPDAEAEFLREHPVLLRRQAERALKSAAEAQSEPNPAVAAFGMRARNKLETLKRLRGDDRAGR